MRRTPLALCLLLALCTCARNPVTGKRQFTLVSQRDEIALGQAAAQDVRQSLGLVEDAALQQYVSSIGMRMARASERPDIPWSFAVVDDPAVNAFALPGGPIFITRGLLARLNSEAELAAVLGHEIAHITARHAVGQLTRAQLAQVGLGLGGVLSPDLARYGQLAAAGLQLLFLRYGRDAERQSDELGLRYMLEAGYDPQEMTDVFVTLRRVGEASEASRLPSWLTTHPDPEDRLEATRERIAALALNPEALKVQRAEFLQQLRGLPYGQNPRQGFFQDNLFLHPDLRFQLRFPRGWKTANQTQAVLGVSPRQDAVVGLGLVAGLPPEQAARAFLAQQGVRPLAASSAELPGAALWFEATTEGGLVRGVTTFLTHQGTTLQLVGYTAAGQLPAYESEFRATLRGFQPLTDPAALAVQPARIELVRLPQAMTLAQFHERYPSPLSLRELASLNGVEPGALLEAGLSVKRVVGGVLPPR